MGTITSMNLKHLEQLLIDSLSDFKLDNSERYEFTKLASDLEADQIGFMKNKAFDISRPHIEKGGAEAVKTLNWLERVIKSIQPKENNITIKSSAYFSPGASCRGKIIDLVESARASIEICVFTISDDNITKAILAAFERGINVTIISDNDKANDRGSDIYFLQEKGVNVILDRTRYHMHHKFAIFDQRILLNGSFNWTRSASEVNEENILVTAEPEVVKAFHDQFSRLKSSLS